MFENDEDAEAFVLYCGLEVRVFCEPRSSISLVGYLM